MFWAGDDIDIAGSPAPLRCGGPVGLAFSSEPAPGPPPTALVLVGHGSLSNNTTINIAGLPFEGDIQAGDLCIILNRAGNSSGVPAKVVPSGFEEMVANEFDSGTFGARAVISAKKLTGNETTVTGMDGTGADFWAALLFRPNGNIAGITAHSISGEITNGLPAPQAIGAEGETSLPIVLVGQMASSMNITAVVDAPGMDAVPDTPNTYRAHYKLYAVGDEPQDHAYAMTGIPGGTGQNNTLQSCYLTFEIAP